MSEPIRVPFPWHKTMVYATGGLTYYGWKPGIRWEDGFQDRDAVADGMGAMLIVEIGRYTPPGYRQRVFYTRQFVLPNGTLVGRPKLRVMGAAGFTRLCKGYRYPFEIADTYADVTMESDHPTIGDLADAASL